MTKHDLYFINPPQGLTNHKFDLERKDLALKDIMDAPLLPNKEDIEDVCISALKEKDIEAKLRQVTSEWSLQELSFQVGSTKIFACKKSIFFVGNILWNNIFIRFSKTEESSYSEETPLLKL